MKICYNISKLTAFLLAACLLTACSGSGMQHYPSNTPQAKSAKLLDDHKMQVASAVALSLVYYCKNENWPPQNTLASRNSKLARSFLTLQNYTDNKGEYHIRFKLKAPVGSGLDATNNPEWLITIADAPSGAWAKGPVYVPVNIKGTSAGEELKNIKPSRQFKAECKPDNAWAAWYPETDVQRFEEHLKAENALEAQTKIAMRDIS